jgi:DNA ligase (NAD+)
VVRCSSDWIACDAQRKAGLEHFVSRKAMNIDGVGPELIERLVDARLLITPADFYHLTMEQLMQLDRMAEKSVSNILAAIEASKKTTLQRFLFALGIRYVGENTSKQLALHFRGLHQIVIARYPQLIMVKDIGDVAASSIIHFFANNETLVKALVSAGIYWPEPELLVTNEQHPLKGKTFVITGSFPNYNREELTTTLEKTGATVTTSVSKKTDYAVVGEAAGSKATKATELSIPILDETSVLKLISIV